MSSQIDQFTIEFRVKNDHEKRRNRDWVFVISNSNKESVECGGDP